MKKLALCASLFFSVSAVFAASTDPAAPADSLLSIAGLTSKDIEKAAKDVGASREQVLFAEAVLAEAKRTNSSELSPALLRNTITQYLLRPVLSIEQVAEIIAKVGGVSLKNASTGSMTKDARGVDLVSHLLLPYMFEAGLCSGDPWTPGGLICGYINPGKGGTVKGRIGASGSSPARDFQKPPASSSLRQILDLAESKCQKNFSARNSAPNRKEVDEELLPCVQLKGFEGEVVVVRLDNVEFDLYYIKLLAKLVPPGPYTAVFFLVGFLAEFYIEVEVYGEYYLAGSIQYLTNDSDSVFLEFPFGFSCTIFNCAQVASCAGASDDPTACIDRYATREFWTLRSQGGFLKHGVKQLAALPLPYQSRAPFQVIQQGGVKLPYDAKFQTSFQTSPALPASAAGYHLYPEPTSNTTSGDQTITTYDFSRVDTWNYNLIFAGLASTAPVINSPGIWTFGDQTAVGDIAWMWHGAGQGITSDCRDPPFVFDLNCPDYIGRQSSSPLNYPYGIYIAMPTVDLLWALDLKHESIFCGLEALAPPCSGADCVPATIPPPLPCSGVDCVPPGIPPPVPTTPQTPSKLSIVSATATESNSAAVSMKFTVRRDGDTTRPARVSFVTSDNTAMAGQDYIANSGTLNFAPGQAQAEISVDVLPDMVIEGVELFNINLVFPIGATVAVDETYGTITDDVVTAVPPIPPEVSEPGKTVRAIGVDSASYNSCALLSNGNVQCWGENRSGQSDGYLGRNAIAIRMYDYYSCALLSTGNVQCWGNNSHGETAGYTGGNATAVSLGEWHSCALLSNGNVQCWGNNSFGESNGYFGGNATAVSSGPHYSCALLSTGNVQCWGDNYYGQSAGYSDGNATAVSSDSRRSCALLSTGNVQCWGDNEYGQSAGYSGGNAIAVSLSTWHSCALLSTGNVRCWGDNYYGQSAGYLGGNATTVKLGQANSCALLSTGNVQCWGDNYYGQSAGYLGGNATAASTDGYHSCSLLSNGNVHCWGWNQYGQTGGYGNR